MNRFSKWIAVGVGAIALGVLAISVACGTTSSSSTTTEMRVVPLSPDSPALDLLIDNKVVFGGLAYGVPTAFSSVTAINHDLKLNQTNNSQNLIDHPMETFATGTSYTYLVIGFAGAGVQIARMIDDHTLATAGNFKLRVVNGSPNSGSVDVYIVTPGTDFVTANPPIKPTLSLASDSISAYQMMASGGYDIYVTPGGDQSCLLQTPTTCLINLDGRNGTTVPSFQAGQNRTLIMLNQVGALGSYTTLPMLADLN